MKKSINFFRVWNKEDKKCENECIFYLDNEGDLYYESWDDGLICVTDSYEVHFSTGLNDKNGTMIYEGDIVKYTSAPSKSNPGAIPFIENHKILWNETYGGYNTQRFNGVNCHCIATVQKQIEVIGNVYENPELLEMKND